jgi:hypothetical protein
VKKCSGMFQAAQLVHGDDVSVAGTSVSDIDLGYLGDFTKVDTKKTLKNKGNPWVECFLICGS